MKRQRPTVFISSTAEDLGEYRQQAREAALAAGFYPEMHEYWVARDNPPFDECMARVDRCDVLVVLVAHRYGWEPSDQPEGGGAEPKSITWLECERARGKGIDVLAFIVDDPTVPLRKESDDLVGALAQHGPGEEFQRIAGEVHRRTRRLDEFKAWLGDGLIRRECSDTRSVREAVDGALREWRYENVPRDVPVGPKAASLPAVPPEYLAWLRQTWGSVELLGLDPEEAFVPRLSAVYVPAVTPPVREAMERGDDPAAHAREQPRDALLLARLDEESLYVPGDPGAGKSTFCKWVTWMAAAGEIEPHRIAAPDEYCESFPESLRARLPVFLQLREFWSDLASRVGEQTWTQEDLEAALAQWTDAHRPGGLTGALLRTCLDRGQTLLILDGVDEVPTSVGEEKRCAYPRALLLTGLADALPAWGRAGNRILLTSRPYGLAPGEVARLGLPSAPLSPVPGPLQRLFVARWFAAADPDRATDKTEGLWADIAQREELRELTGNPMLLTALCVLYNQDQRLPEDQYFLYHRVINGVLYGRYRDEARQRRPVRGRLAAIAHGMHTGCASAEARATPAAEVGEGELELILRDFAAHNRATEGELDDAARKCADLLENSGLLLSRSGDRAAFYHQSFQEYLAAEHVARTVRGDDSLKALMRERGAVAGWGPTLVHLFAALVFRHRDEQWAVDTLLELSRGLTREQLRENAAPAVWLAECVEIAVLKGWHLGELHGVFTELCLHAIEDEIEVTGRARLGLTLGRLGDPRPGVGVRADGVPDIEWVRIPAGHVVMGRGDGARDVAAFEIARYPVTNAQFQAFVDAADGYHGEGVAWWSELERSAPSQPRWSEPNAPRETVSWYEAVAFCRWLAARLNCDVRLPDEFEWQQAATGGDPTREFPWGDWQAHRCNSVESGIRRTSAVGIFASGGRAGGPADMAGNVLEWCRNDPGFDSRSGFRVYRGGSWADEADFCRAAFRNFVLPTVRNFDLGFRPARFVTE